MKLLLCRAAAEKFAPRVTLSANGGVSAKRRGNEEPPQPV